MMFTKENSKEGLITKSSDFWKGTTYWVMASDEAYMSDLNQHKYTTTFIYYETFEDTNTFITDIFIEL